MGKNVNLKHGANVAKHYLLSVWSVYFISVGLDHCIHGLKVSNDVAKT